MDKNELDQLRKASKELSDLLLSLDKRVSALEERERKINNEKGQQELSIQAEYLIPLIEQYLEEKRRREKFNEHFKNLYSILDSKIDSNTDFLINKYNLINNLQNTNNEGHFPPTAAISTRQRSIIEMQSQIAEYGIEGNISGNGNRGNNRIYFTEDGKKRKYIYLSTSRNYSSSNDGFSSWHTISPEDINSKNYDFFILSAEDESETPQFFIFTRSQMQNFVQNKSTDSRPYYHFYISRDDEGNYVDSRKDNKNISQQVSQYHNNWSLLSQE